MHEAYQLKFDEINALGLSDKSRDEAEDAMVQLLAEAYYLGLHEAEMMLFREIDAELDELEDILWTEIDGKTFVDRLDEHLANGTSIETLARSEFHRVYNAALFAAGKRGGATTKTWVTMGDWRVRETHDSLEGATVGIDDYFYSFSGDKALRPGGFATAAENSNCRCSLLIR